MINAKMKKYTLNEKEFETMTKAHDEFNKTIFGRRVRLFIMIFRIYGILFFVMSLLCMIFYVDGGKNFDIFAAICGALFFGSSSLGIVLQIQYEHMVMDYIGFKK